MSARGALGALAAAAFVAGAAALSWACASRVVAILDAPARAEAAYPVTFEITKGTSAAAISRQLATAHLVDDARVLRAWLGVSGLAGRLRAGEYQVAQPLSVVQMAELLASGKVLLHAVTIPEGLNLRETAQSMAASGLWTPAELEQAFSDPSPVRDLDPDAPDLEGYLFPETYMVPRGEPARDVARLMVARFRDAWLRAGGTAGAQAPDAAHATRAVVTLASLVEKETGVPEERPVVAQVFWKRLEMRMKLESDPTTIYAMQRDGSWKGGPLQLTDLARPIPYNTYVTPALPPGPIASPGEGSLRAALHPAETEYLYFVATGKGGHNFAATLREHQRNVAAYRKEMKAR